jgi:hypothetical protein
MCFRVFSSSGYDIVCLGVLTLTYETRAATQGHIPEDLLAPS